MNTELYRFVTEFGHEHSCLLIDILNEFYIYPCDVIEHSQCVTIKALWLL